MFSMFPTFPEQVAALLRYGRWSPLNEASFTVYVRQNVFEHASFDAYWFLRHFSTAKKGANIDIYGLSKDQLRLEL